MCVLIQRCKTYNYSSQCLPRRQKRNLWKTKKMLILLLLKTVRASVTAAKGEAGLDGKEAHLAAILWIPTANPLHHNHNRYTEPLEINVQSLDGSQINLTTLAHLKSVKMAQQCNPRHFVMCVILILATIEENFPIWLKQKLKLYIWYYKQQSLPMTAFCAMILRKIYQSCE